MWCSATASSPPVVSRLLNLHCCSFHHGPLFRQRCSSDGCDGSRGGWQEENESVWLLTGRVNKVYTSGFQSPDDQQVIRAFYVAPALP